MDNPNFPKVPAGAPKPDLDRHMRGGEYFFMPSLAFLRGLAV